MRPPVEISDKIPAKQPTRRRMGNDVKKKKKKKTRNEKEKKDHLPPELWVQILVDYYCSTYLD